VTHWHLNTPTGTTSQGSKNGQTAKNETQNFEKIVLKNSTENKPEKLHSGTYARRLQALTLCPVINQSKHGEKEVAA